MNSCIIQELKKKYNMGDKFKTILKKRKRKEKSLINQNFRGFKRSIRLDVLKRLHDG